MATKKSIIIWGFVGILIIVALFMGSTTQAAESKAMKCRVSCYYVYLEFLPVEDKLEGHSLGMFSRKGLAFFESGEVATFTNWGTGEHIKGKSTFLTYAMFTFEDGSTIEGKYEGTGEPMPKGLMLFNGRGNYIKGTGRFEGIEGSFTWSGKTLTPYSKETKSDFYFDVVGTYTLPPK